MGWKRAGAHCLLGGRAGGIAGRGGYPCLGKQTDCQARSEKCPHRAGGRNGRDSSGAFTPLAQAAHYETIFVVLFYLFNTALVVFYAYQAVDDEVQPQPRVSLDDFLSRYGISKREADIVHGIYAGKTNQEIANQLFITLQTVKDHSSRIYQKTFVKNRAQLTTLIRETQNVS